MFDSLFHQEEVSNTSSAKRPNFKIRRNLLLILLFQACNGKILFDTETLFSQADFEGEEFSVEFGRVTFNDPEVQRRVKSGQMTWIREIQEDVQQYQNVQRVMGILSEANWSALFPISLEKYSYTNFLKAIAQFPAFCNEYDSQSAHSSLQSPNLACRRELATLFAHMTFETANDDHSEQPYERTGLSMDEARGCEGGKGPGGLCHNHDKHSNLGKIFEEEKKQDYYGRGPIQLRWNSMYGRFSKAYYDDDYNGYETLLKNPDLLLDDSQAAFSSLLWLYMTPHFPKPSAHDVVTGLFSPNERDQEFGIGNDFGTTIAIMAQDASDGFTAECYTQSQVETSNSQLRAGLYKVFKMAFNLPNEDESTLGCASKRFEYNGAGEVKSFWQPGQNDRCNLVNYETQFSIYNEQDYQRCVCYGEEEKKAEKHCPQRNDIETPICQWSNKFAQTRDILIPVTSADEYLIQINLNENLGSLQYSQCNMVEDGQGSSIVEADFYTFELTKDNFGNTADSSLSFKFDNTNSNDGILGELAPEDMLIAANLNQKSIVFGVDIFNTIQTQYDAGVHEGVWEFTVKACVDRRRLWGYIDCDPGFYFVQVAVVEVCKTDDASLYDECDDQVDPDPVDPDPVDPDPVDPDPVDPDPVDPDPEDPEPEDPDPVDPDPEDPDPVDPDPEDPDPVNPEDPDPVNPQPTDPDLDDLVKDDDDDKQQTDPEPERSSFDPQQVFEVARGSVLTIDLTYIATFEALMPTLELKMKKWISYDEQVKVFTLTPSASTPLGLKQVQVEVDGSPQMLNFWVLPAEEVPDDPDPTDPGKGSEDPQPDPKPVPDPDPDLVPKNSAKNDGFDPTILRGRDEIFQKVQRLQQQIIISDQVDIEDPQSTIDYINEIGDVKLKFSQTMYLDVVLEGYVFESTDQNQNETRRRLSDDESRFIDLSSLINTQIVIGNDETSSPIEELGYKVAIESFTQDQINLKLNFENPLSVSIGKQPDIFILSFVQPELFISKETGRPLAPDPAILNRTIPKQFPNEASYSLAVMAGSTVQVAANTAFLSQFGVTICLAVSLKAMWNLMHVMQVMAYLRLVVDWPANSNMMLLSMHNAITLENIINGLYDSIFGVLSEKFEGGYEDEEDALLKKNDIAYKNIGLSLGIFGIFLGVLVLLLLFYFVVKLLSIRFQCVDKLVKSLKKKLFYSVWIRYLIESNLKMTHNCIFYLYISGGFNDIEEGVSSAIRMLLITIIVIWPFFMTAFLYVKRSRLDEKGFKQKIIAMYMGIKTKKFTALMYTSVFCIRRMLLVCSLLGLQLVLQKQDIWLILTYNALQSLYFWYMTSVRPHEETIHNRLEYFNELCVITMQYSMIFFISGSGINPEIQWDIGIAVMTLVGFVFFSNMIALFYLAICRTIFWLKVRKVRNINFKARQAEKVNKQKMRAIVEEKLNEARQFSRVDDEIFSNRDCSTIKNTQADALEPRATNALTEANHYDEDDSQENQTEMNLRTLRPRANTLQQYNKDQKHEDKFTGGFKSLNILLNPSRNIALSSVHGSQGHQHQLETKISLSAMQTGNTVQDSSYHRPSIHKRTPTLQHLLLNKDSFEEMKPQNLVVGRRILRIESEQLDHWEDDEDTPRAIICEKEKSDSSFQQQQQQNSQNSHPRYSGNIKLSQKRNRDSPSDASDASYRDRSYNTDQKIPSRLSNQPDQIPIKLQDRFMGSNCNGLVSPTSSHIRLSRNCRQKNYETTKTTQMFDERSRDFLSPEPHQHESDLKLKWVSPIRSPKQSSMMVIEEEIKKPKLVLDKSRKSMKTPYKRGQVVPFDPALMLSQQESIDEEEEPNFVQEAAISRHDYEQYEDGPFKAPLFIQTRGSRRPPVKSHSLGVNFTQKFNYNHTRNSVGGLRGQAVTMNSDVSSTSHNSNQSSQHRQRKDPTVYSQQRQLIYGGGYDAHVGSPCSTIPSPQMQFNCRGRQQRRDQDRRTSLQSFLEAGRIVLQQNRNSNHTMKNQQLHVSREAGSDGMSSFNEASSMVIKQMQQDNHNQHQLRGPRSALLDLSEVNSPINANRNQQQNFVQFMSEEYQQQKYYEEDDHDDQQQQQQIQQVQGGSKNYHEKKREGSLERCSQFGDN